MLVGLLLGTAVAAMTVPPARDPEIAVAEEWQMAKSAGSVEALELFIRRHPCHPLAEEARREKAEILQRDNNRK